jgi:hypothetical protein
VSAAIRAEFPVDDIETTLQQFQEVTGCPEEAFPDLGIFFKADAGCLSWYPVVSSTMPSLFRRWEMVWLGSWKLTPVNRMACASKSRELTAA